MAEQIVHLELAWRTRSGGAGTTEVRYLDFCIDGQSLGELLRAGDLIGCLGWGQPKYEEEAAQVLLLRKPSPLETGRVMLYVCPECGDIGCGAITVVVEQTANHYVWRGFSYENDYDSSMLNLEQYQAFGPYLFNKTEYWHTLSHRPSGYAA